MKIKNLKNGQKDQVLFGDFQGKNFSPLGPLWVVERTTKLYRPKNGQKGAFIMNAQMNIAELLNVAARTEDLRLKGEILMYAFNNAKEEHSIRENGEKIYDEIHKVAMDLIREEVTLDTDYVGLYKIYRDCENDETKNNTFARHLNYVRSEVTYELLCVMAEQKAKVLREVITKEEFAQKSFNDFLADIDFRSECCADFPMDGVSVDDYFWAVIGY